MKTTACRCNTRPAKTKDVEIQFYRASERPYGAFSNLFRRTVIFEGLEFPTAEHAYQAGKPRKKEVREWILSAPTPSLVAIAAHGLYTWDIVPNWAEIKFDRMRQVLRAKFEDEELQELLLSTGSARLVESGRVNNPVNRTWGEVNGKGLNMLGVLLMELRTELRKICIAMPEGRTANGRTNGAIRAFCPSLGAVESTGLEKHAVYTLRR
jgi:ribA/ribD-fused uncharacterized protein